MIKNLKVQKAVTAMENDSVVAVARLLRDHKVRHVYVTNAKKELKGVISTIDINNKIVAEGKHLDGLKAKDILMNAESAERSQESEYAMRIMMRHKTFTCPVVEKGVLVGVVDYQDVLASIVKKVRGNQS